ncbi:MAG: hypothetical protein VKJ46_04680 [Leptolyngbyaceae bacterium]|nr:hypothetical protein [Leptolyngbyaceae bacterium]
MNLAKQGEVGAIATLLNQAFANKGITVKVNLKDGCLKVLVEAAQVPPVSPVTTTVQQVIVGLDSPLIQSLKVYGRETGTEKPAWSQEVGLETEPSLTQTLQPLPELRTPSEKQISQLRQLAKQGDEGAIADVLNHALAHKQITTQVALEAGDLQITLQAESSPDPNIAVVLIDRELTKLNSALIQRVIVQGQASGNDPGDWREEFEPGSRSQLPSHHSPLPAPIQAATAAPARLRPRAVEQEGLNALLAGLILAIVFTNISLFTILFQGFLVLVHEVGHAVTHWLFGRPAIPSVDLAFGGGVTLVFGQSGLVIGLIYLILGGLLFLCRSYPRLLIVVGAWAGVYSFCLLTNWNLILSTFMGHGMELIAMVGCLYLSTSGYFCRFAGDRSIYAMLGFFTLFRDIGFSWGLLHNADLRDWYEQGKGGVLDNDFVILANEYFHVNLSVVSGWFLVACFLAPFLAFALFRYEAWWRAGLSKLIVRS